MSNNDNFINVEFSDYRVKVNEKLEIEKRWYCMILDLENILSENNK